MEKTGTLIMLDKPILVNEEEVTENDFYYAVGMPLESNFTYPYPIACKKIIAGHEGTKPLRFDLSEEDAKRIGYVDVEAIIKDWYNTAKFKSSFIADPSSFKQGFQAALSLTPKKYTEEQSIEIFNEGVCRGYSGDSEIDIESCKEFLEYMRQPQQFKASYTETENEITITKIL